MSIGLKKEDFRLDIDEALLVYSVLKKLGSGSVATFNDRLKSQKVQYLAQAFGVSPTYGFSLYLHGPYSPALTHDLFIMAEKKVVPDLSDFIPDGLKERFETLKEFIKRKSTRDLELIATLHLFKSLSWPKDKAVAKLKILKNATDEEIQMSFDQIKNIP
jgi:uncharacterized protein YwgA